MLGVAWQEAFEEIFCWSSSWEPSRFCWQGIALSNSNREILLEMTGLRVSIVCREKFPYGQVWKKGQGNGEEFDALLGLACSYVWS